MPTPVPDAVLRTRWLREIESWWRYYDWIYLGSTLRAPSFALSESRRVLGRWWSDRRLIEVSALHVQDDPWTAVLDTLRHEMAHQFVEEVLQVRSEPPHGPAFRDACTRLRVEASACARAEAGSGAPTPEPRRPQTEPEFAGPGGGAVLDRIHKLLSLATSPNEHEARAAMNKARQLLLQHNLELRDLRGPEQYRHRRVGSMKARREAWEYLLGSLLSDFFFVHVLWAPDYDALRDRKGRVMELYGTPFNLDMAVYVHGYFEQLLPRLWSEYRRRHGLRSVRDRRTYFAGVMTGFREQLEAQDARWQQEDALIWTGDPGLDRYFRHHQPRTQSRSTGGAADSEAYRDGVRQGHEVRLRKPLKSGGTAQGRRLGDGGGPAR